MNAADRALAQEVAALKAALAVVRAEASEDTALIAQQKLRIAKLERQVYGQRSERSARLIDQLSLTFEELESGATEDELAAEAAVARTTNVAGFTRNVPSATRSPTIFLASACWSIRRQPANAAAATDCASLART